MTTVVVGPERVVDVVLAGIVDEPGRVVEAPNTVDEVAPNATVDAVDAVVLVGVEVDAVDWPRVS